MGASVKDNFAGYPPGPWLESEIHRRWQVQPSGDQTVQIITDGEHQRLHVGAEPIGRNEGTRAALVTSVKDFKPWSHLEITYRTVQQHRDPLPADWEVAWALFNYTDTNHFYAVVLKTDGWELSKEYETSDGEQDQDFLATGHAPFPVGHLYRVTINQLLDISAVTLTVHVQDLTAGTPRQRLCMFRDDGKRPSGPAYRHGHVGLYTEDCTAHYHEVLIH
jgi:hypothetical protein